MSAPMNGNGHAITRRTRPDDLPELLTVDEVRAWLNISRGAAYGLIASGEIKSVKLGRCIRVPKSALAELAR